MAMTPAHRLAHQLERPDGGAEWACPQCGHSLVCYPHTQVVVLHGVVADADIDAYLTPYIANPAQVQALERFILAFDPAQTIRIQDRLKQLTTPTAIVWGTGDIVFDERWSYWLADTIPRTRSRTSLEGARLLFPEERPQELNREILRLWELDQ